MPNAVQLSPLSLSETRQLLRRLQTSPSKKLGQNFLIDKNIVQKSVELANVRKEDVIVEVGPGLGTLSRALLACGCEEYAIEFDNKLYQYLTDAFSGIERFHLLHGDAVEHPLAGLDRFDGPFKIVANLPYNISTPWMDAVLSREYLPESMTLMLQKETALRFQASENSKHVSALSITLAAAYDCKTMFPVSRNSFMPPPDVDSVILHLEKKEKVYRFHPSMCRIMRQIFTQRRKQARSLVRTFYTEGICAFDSLLEKNNYILSVRPEQLPPSFWIEWDRLCFGE